MRTRFSHPWLRCGALFLAGASAVFGQGILVPRGAVWKYLDNGSDQGTAWYGTNFNDSTWASGAARLGYGGDGEVTTVSYGPDPNNTYITTYFRRSFVVTNAAAFATLTLNLLRDDGAVVYLNGTEVRRDNMPAGVPTYTTLATTLVAGTDEQTYFSSLISGSYLVTGTNQLAVEIHQGGTNSPDIALDLELRGTNVFPSVAILSPANNSVFVAGTNLTLTASAADSDGAVTKVEYFQGGVKLGESANSPYSVVWNTVVDGQYTLTAVATDNDGATATSAPIVITVNDTNPPALLSAVASANGVTVNFSKRLDTASATDINHYAINNGVQVLSANLGSSSNVVVLGTSPLTSGVNYTLTVNDIRDPAGNPIVPNSQTTFNLVPYSPTDIGGPGISGSMSFSGGTYTLTGGGSDIGGASDQFFFSYQQLTGDF
ncbi:MAG TPA: Ig-like domain-containing protein, partial [Candidatus Angelobacter sp.]|nr:Ig-like domain-containing protein [Candidatus Angelobacter sp.]